MVHISDHAILRYLERVKGVDIDAIRREMDSPAVAIAAEFGCDTVKRGDGSRLKLVGDVVQTVIPAPTRPSGRHRRRRANS